MSDAWAEANTLPRLLESRASETPDGIAFQVETAANQWLPVSWKSFANRAARLQNALVASGLRKGDRLAIAAPVSLEWELIHHACLGMGAVVIGLDAHDLPERIADMADQADITAVAVSDHRVLSRLTPERLDRLRFVLRMDESDAAEGFPDRLRGIRWGELEGCATAAAFGEAPVATDLATIIFTSGTTGAPKGISYTHEQVCLAAVAIRDVFSFVPPDGRLLCWLPLSNLFQRIVNLAAIRHGVCTWLLDDPRRVMDVVGEVEPDVFIGVPRVYEKLHAAIQKNIASQSGPKRRIAEWAWEVGRKASRLRLAGRAYPPLLAFQYQLADRVVLRRIRSVMGRRLQCMVSGSAPMPRHLLDEFHALGWLLLEAYGLSENVLPMAMNRPLAFRFGSVGRPLEDNQISIGPAGALRVRGPGVFSGYIDEPGARHLDADGFYTTGDLGEIDAEGYLRLTGRISDLIKTSTGRRIAPVNAETQLQRVPGIDQAMLLGSGRKCTVALCTCSEPALDEAARAQLVASLGERTREIAEAERPRAIGVLARPFSVVRGELTSNLKLRRAAIEESNAELVQRLFDSIEDQGEASGSLRVIFA